MTSYGNCCGKLPTPNARTSAIFRLPMRGLVSRKTFLWVFVALVPVTIFALNRSEADRIRNDLENLVSAMQFEDRAGSAMVSERLRAAAIERMAPQVVVALEPHGELSVPRNSLLENFVGWSAQWSALGVSLEDLSVRLDADERRAMAKGEALLVRVDAGGVRWTEPRRFALTLERQEKHWVVRQIRISEPRIDQPEARP